MRTTYIGIEAIFVLPDDRVTIACNIMLQGKFYDQPIYTNIFCDYSDLCIFLNLDNSDLSKKILREIEAKRIKDDGEQIEVQIPDYINNKIEWKFPTMVDLKVSINEDIPMECYEFTDITKKQSQKYANH